MTLNQRNNLCPRYIAVSKEKCVCAEPAIGGNKMDDGDTILGLPTES